MHSHHKVRKGEERDIDPAESGGTVALVGNPNVGKSVIFGLLTGKYVIVSNYPGTTVELSSGNIEMDGRRYLVLDTPGVNSLVPMSEDERVTRDILLRDRPSVVVQVGDAKNLKRTLMITMQLAEMNLPVILDLNMEDEAMDRGITIDYHALSKRLGIDVIPTVAPERRGLKELRDSIKKGGHTTPKAVLNYGPVIEDYIEKIKAFIPKANISRRSIAVMILSGDPSLSEWLGGNLSPADIDAVEALREECRLKVKKPLGLLINEARLDLASEAAGAVTTKDEGRKTGLLPLIGRWSMHPVWGLFVLAGVLFGIYEFVGVLGADILVGFVEETLFGEYLNPMFTKVVKTLMPIKFVQEMLVGQYGAITMAVTYAIGIIFPITATFFIAFSILEDSGYLPRLAIMSNRLFNVMGLSGKAVLPMVLGLGCGTMAVMTTRILETRRDRLIATFLLALAVPCAAQLGVIMGMLGSLSAKAMGVWLLSITGVLLLSGYLASKIIKGESSDFFLEIPPIRVPKITNVLIKTQNRVVWYLKEAVPLFIIGTFILFVLDKVHVLGFIERLVSPVVVGMMGLPEKTAEAFLIGFFRRDYGAAGLFAMFEKGLLTPSQAVVSLVTITLFVPCLAHFLMMIKERGLRLSLMMTGIILAIAVSFGSALNLGLNYFKITL